MAQEVALLDNIVDGETIEEIDVVGELVTSYRQYALYVLLSRAFPRVEDGLKPVVRRILYAMHTEGYLHTKATVKAAKPVAITMGNFHPHGDSSIYDALVGISQPWQMNVPYIITQGNWGSATTNDGAAAMRYTECTLDLAGEEMVNDIQYETVDMLDTYDQGGKEPEVLPGLIPALLVNGSYGIGVGFSCSFAPHNLTEVCKGIKALIADPEMGVDEMMKIIPGPDFPTAAQIIDNGQIRQGYATGRGNLTVRAPYTIESPTARTRALVFTEMPFRVILERVVEDIMSKKNDGLAFADVINATDQSGDDPRLVVQIRTTADPETIAAELYKNTALESTFSLNNIGIVDYQAKQLTLLDMIEGYIAHRKDVLERKYRFLLQKALDRLHIVDGLMKAFNILDDLITEIRGSSSGAVAKKNIVKKFSFSDPQAEAILAMRLSSLASLEITELQKEHGDLTASVAEYNKILGSEAELLKLIVADQDYLIKTYGRPRSTKIISGKAAEKVTAPVEAAPVAHQFEHEVLNLALTHEGNLLVTNDLPAEQTLGQSHTSVKAGEQVRAFTANGKHYLLDSTAIAASGFPAEDYIADFDTDDRPIMGLVGDLTADVILVTRTGVLKKISADAYAKKQGLPAIKLAEGDELIAAFPAIEGQDGLMISSAGKALRVDLTKIRAQGRTSAGVQGMKFADADTRLLAAGAVTNSATVATVTTLGNSKVLSAADIPVKGRATGGITLQSLRKGETGLTHALVTATAAFAATADGAQPLGEATPKTQAAKPLVDSPSNLLASA